MEGVDCGADGAVGREVGGGRVSGAAAALGGRGMETWEASLQNGQDGQDGEKGMMGSDTWEERWAIRLQFWRARW